MLNFLLASEDVAFCVTWTQITAVLIALLFFAIWGGIVYLFTCPIKQEPHERVTRTYLDIY